MPHERDGAEGERVTPEEGPLQVPHEALSPEALRGVIESFVLREGTDYGAHEVPLEHKIEQVLKQLRRGEARIVFDPASDSIDIVPALPRRSA